MKVVSLNTDEEVNKFLGNENIKVESITPVSNESNGIIWAIVYKEKVIIKKEEIQIRVRLPPRDNVEALLS